MSPALAIVIARAGLQAEEAAPGLGEILLGVLLLVAGAWIGARLVSRRRRVDR